MSTFPRLSTGAIAQYPAVREVHFSTQIHRYLDTSEQRYRDAPASRKRWTIDLSRLDESEVTRLMEFFSEQQGRFGSFNFEDPWTGSLVANCRFEQDHAAAASDGEWNNGTRLTIVEPAAS